MAERADTTVNHADTPVQYGSEEGTPDSGVYHPGEDAHEIYPAADRATQVRLNWQQHEDAVAREVAKWKKAGYIVVRNINFIDPTDGTPIVADFAVSYVGTDGLFPIVLPLFVKDVKTGRGGLTPNQAKVYPYILKGGKVIPVGMNAALAGFEIGEPTSISELYVGGDEPSDTEH